MYALLVIDETMVSSQPDNDRIQKHLKSDGVTKIHEHSFLVDLAKASLALADLQIMAKSKHRPFQIFYFQENPTHYYSE
ncbi:MAG: hypothetical protein E7D55_02360 [Acinetobacter junii]|nr:hypothetical protein [Acinetobacter junii]